MGTSGLTLCTLNCNGLRAAIRKDYAGWLASHRPDVLCLQEVRAAPEQVPPEIYQPEGYEGRWVLAEKPGYSGVALYSRQPVRRWSVGTGLDWGDAEGRCLMAQRDDITVVSLYIPSGTSGEARQTMKYAYLDHLLDWTGALIASGAPVLICGDFNIAHAEIDIHNPKANAKSSGFLPEERQWFTRWLAQGWVDLFRHLNPTQQTYSWWSNRGQARALNRGWRIDYVLASPALAGRAEAAWIQTDAGLSDHAPVFVRLRA